MWFATPQVFYARRLRGAVMGLVFCVTRGGKENIRAQNTAISWAKDRNEHLVFLFVVDTSFLNRIGMCAFWRIAENELAKLGEFLLIMAVERAMLEGVKAKSIVRSGVLCEILPKVAREMEATTVVFDNKAGETCLVEATKLWRGYDASPDRNG
jgi:hypothetical protein